MEWSARTCCYCCFIYTDQEIFTHHRLFIVSHRCQPSRKHAGNSAFWLIFRIFARTSRISGFISKQRKPLQKIKILLAVWTHFVRNCSAKTSLIASPSYLKMVILDSKIRIFRLSTSAPMDIHLVRVAQYVDVLNVR